MKSFISLCSRTSFAAATLIFFVEPAFSETGALSPSAARAERVAKRAWGWGPTKLIEGTLRGKTHVEGEPTFLPGVSVLVTDPTSGLVVARGESDGSGAFALTILPGTYRVTASLAGFSSWVREPVVVEAGKDVELDMGLSIAPVEETVQVRAEKSSDVPLSIPQTATSVESVRGDLVDVAPVSGSDFQALLPLLPGVVRGPDGRVSVKGGQATQSSLLVNSTTVTDPVTGDFGFALPADAIESVTLLPNPYAAEYGRFSSGVSAIATRQGGDTWRFLVNNFIPRPRIREGVLRGFESFTPRLSVTGPLLKGRLYLAQTFRYRNVKTRVPVRPEIRNDQRLQSFDSFTQLDLRLGARHRLTGTLSVFPSDLDFVNVDTFNPREVSANFHQRGWNAAISERATLSEAAVLETNVAFKRYDVEIFGQGTEDMEIRPDGNGGNFYNRQDRATETLELLQTLTLQKQGVGDHLVKFGFDVLHSRFEGESESRPVNVRRADGSLAQRLEFGPSSTESARTADLALFAQDRWRIREPLLFELGARVDRDGVLERTNVAPRAGISWSVLPSGRSVLRGGAGLFYSQTTLNVKAFESYESLRVFRFQEDGVSLAGAPTSYAPRRVLGLETPSSFTWNLEYDQRAGDRWLFKANYLRRNGRDEFIIDPGEPGEPGNSTLDLSSRGRSRYWELELTTRYALADTELFFTYVRSQAKADLNALDRFYGNFRNPIIRANEFSLADTDVPHRFLFRGSVGLPGGLKVSPVLEVRTGFPYSLVDENQDFVGRRNLGGRFPRLVSLDVDVQRRVTIGKLKARIGFRVFHVFNNFAPRDVQRNVHAPRFGTFSNSLDRQFRLNFQLG